MIAALALLDAPRPAQWARVLGLRSHELYRSCRAAFGASPRDVCLAYARACAAEMRATGAALPSIAASLGYSDAPTLLRAVGALPHRPSSRDRS